MIIWIALLFAFIATSPRAALNILLALDAFLFSLTCFGNVYPGEYASSAAYRLDMQFKWQGRLFRPIIDFFFGEKHCYNSWTMQRGMVQSPHISWPAPEVT